MALYLLGWASGAFLVAIIATWLMLLVPLAATTAAIIAAARVSAVASIVALVFVWLFQNPAMHRFGSQVLSLVGLAAVAAIVGGVAARRGTARDDASADVPRLVMGAALVFAFAAGLAATWFVQPGLVSQLLTDVGRLAPDPSRMGVLEARPLFTYPGELNWKQPWQFFRTGFYIGVAGLIPLAIRIVRERRSADALVWVFTAATIGATIGQNRFGYYMVPACALVGGWLADRLLTLGDGSGVGTTRARRSLQQSLAVAAVAVMIAPSLVPSLLFLPRTGMFVHYWQDALTWLHDQTPPPFPTAPGDPHEVLLRTLRSRAVSRCRLLDHELVGSGLLLDSTGASGAGLESDRRNARRMPRRSTPRPTRAAPSSALTRERSRYVLADWELPFRLAPDGSIAGRFQTLADWSGITHRDYYEIAYRRSDDGWTPVWLFYEPYYRSMAYRLTVLGGRAAIPVDATTVVTLTEHADARGFRFREVVSEKRFPTYEAALAALMATRSPATVLAGLDPWQAAFPLPALSTLTEVHQARTAEQKPSEGPWVRIFQVR